MQNELFYCKCYSCSREFWNCGTGFRLKYSCNFTSKKMSVYFNSEWLNREAVSDLNCSLAFKVKGEIWWGLSTRGRPSSQAGLTGMCSVGWKHWGRWFPAPGWRSGWRWWHCCSSCRSPALGSSPSWCKRPPRSHLVERRGQVTEIADFRWGASSASVPFQKQHTKTKSFLTVGSGSCGCIGKSLENVL